MNAADKARPITDIMREVNEGRLVDEASDALKRVIAGVQRSLKKGSVTIVIDVIPDKAGDTAVCELEAKVTVKVPAKSMRKSVFFIDESGNLSRRDARQNEMFEGHEGGKGGTISERAIAARPAIVS